ncbi:MAG: hypothetical protein KF741_06170 [Ferruginibacter sp.]|nr:hypothetical protein [Bacteroidota bacterium]MBX2918815.1 hypothetical protein [Ferruginibacter sp.]
MKKFLPLFLFLLVASMSRSQNVGIGTNNPSEKLHVVGNVKADTLKPSAFKLTSGAGEGKVLTSDANGNASWALNSNSGSNIGYGVWGDCATNGNISEYQPVVDNSGSLGDFGGYSVCISSNFAIVGAPGDDVNTNPDQGSVSIYRHDENGWIKMQKITDAAGTSSDYFGSSVSISGNYAIVGAPSDDVGVNLDQGSASIYQYNGINWLLMQKITDADGAADDNFGISVSISGNYAIVGSHLDKVGTNANQGSASIYQYNGSSWVLMQKITDATGAANDNFGKSVSISGNYAIVGASNDDVGTNTNQGSASIYRYNGSSWVLMQKITDATGAANDNFGTSVSIDNNYAIVGASSDDVGVNSNQGSASIYHYTASSWVLMQKITDVDGAANDNFGTSVSISGNYAIVGVTFDQMGANLNQGSARIYYRNGPLWRKLQNVVDPAGASGDVFGCSVSLDATTRRFLVGAYGVNNNMGIAVFGKIN